MRSSSDALDTAPAVVPATRPPEGSSAALIDPRAEFPLLADRRREPPLVYLDSAATTQKPRAVIDAVDEFYTAP